MGKQGPYSLWRPKMHLQVQSSASGSPSQAQAKGNNLAFGAEATRYGSYDQGG